MWEWSRVRFPASPSFFNLFCYCHYMVFVASCCLDLFFKRELPASPTRLDKLFEFSKVASLILAFSLFGFWRPLLLCVV
ncbi:hypothetical protein BJ875DRAFT_463994 [Amylocarpus encephaloides]|uniref:Transmembrane protein n=1 Tax=Amylocarpus encephaloides TaxID=45428 RepID=A0A9P7YGY7_9HELO|nr:hypothetical protein BJ875DRAFT_463994 [Amylocarpus encephaloides]